MRIIFFTCAWVVTVFANPVVNFTQALTDQQRSLLHEFIFQIVDSPAGYVLYGDKPMHIDRVDLPTLGSLSTLDQKIFTLLKGRELWSDFKVWGVNKQYLLNTFEIGNEAFFISINREAFLKVVEANLSLFQYVLGPKVTPENLLWALANSGDSFFQILKNDGVLIEILSGNGRENAIAHTRLTEIQNPGQLDSFEEFPLISKKLIRNWAIAPNKYKMEPSFGYSSLSKEEIALNEMSSLDQIRKHAVCQLPNFSCTPHSEETKSLLSLYEKNRASVIQALQEGSYFENTLLKFFTTSQGLLDFPKIPNEVHFDVPEAREEIMRQLVKIAHRTIRNEPFGAKKCAKAFLRGILARERDEDWPHESRKMRSRRTQTIQEDLKCSLNLQKADADFKELQNRSDLTQLIPEKLYYKTLKPGKGKLSTSQLEKVTLQFTFQVLGKEPSKDWGMIKNEHIGALIPGIAYALIGMQAGEERVAYIHPSYAYGDMTFFPPNSTIVAQIRLLEFSESDKTAVIFSPHKLQKHDYKDLLVKYVVLRSEEYYYDGLEFWDNVKKSDQFFDFKSFYKMFIEESKELTSSNEHQTPRFISDLGYLLLTLQNTHKYSASS